MLNNEVSGVTVYPISTAASSMRQDQHGTALQDSHNARYVTYRRGPLLADFGVSRPAGIDPLRTSTQQHSTGACESVNVDIAATFRLGFSLVTHPCPLLQCLVR
jgi:hypothetical protein